MTFDPYRVLGVDRTTPIAEIKRAYRRLAKENHPDSAGPGALRRFLEIQAAYEEIVEGKPRARLPGGGSEPAWRADPERARATRDAWRRRSTRADPGTGRTRARGRTGETGERPGTGAAGPEGGAEDSGRSAGTRRTPRGGSKRATPGSTTYDEAANEPFDPAWGGASWYGPSSGTYWTINPKEYADPRKHGPEYQARARRAAAAQTGGPGTEPESPAAGVGGATAKPAGAPEDPARADARTGTRDASRPRPPRPPAGGRRTPRPGSARPAEEPDRVPDGANGQISTDRARPRPASPASDVPRSASPGTGWSAPGPAPAASTSPGFGDAALAALRAPGRGLTALIAWPPIGLALALLHGELTGCSRFAASCTDPASPWPWLIQLAVIAGFLLVPPLARLAAFGTYAIVIVVTPLTLFLATGGGYDPELTARLLFVGLAIAWVAGVAIGIARRRWRSAPSPPVP